jgi:hypothetical protein
LPYLDNVLVSSGSKNFPVFPGTLANTPGQNYEVASYPIRPRLIWELDGYAWPQKVLLHKYRADDVSGNGGYFSFYQEVPAALTDPPVMRIAGTVEENSINVTRDVWLRIGDPPSTAAYETTKRDGDNIDQNSPQLYYFDAQGTRINSSAGILHIQSNQDTVPGRVRVYLQTSPTQSGENYYIEGSFDSAFSCATAGPSGDNVCARTTTFTTWKRVYVERDAMFRGGALLSAAAPAGSTVLHVVNNSAFSRASRNSPVVAYVIHAPNYDGTGPRDRYFETVNVIGAGGRSDPTITLLAPGITKAYGVDTTSPVFSPLPDGVGVYMPATSNPFFSSDTTLMASVFADMFVDYVLLTEGNGGQNKVPYEPPYADVSNNALRDALARKWCDVCDGGLPQNHHYLTGSSTTTPPNTPRNTVVGVTVIDQGPNPYSMVFVDEAEANATNPVFGSCPPMNVPLWVRETTVHELVHGWDVNPPTWQTGGHCLLGAWNSTPTQPEDCGMRRGTTTADPNQNFCNRYDGSFLLHSWINANSEYRRVRALEPLPRVSQH